MQPVENEIGRVGDGEQEEEIARDDARIAPARAQKHQERDEVAEQAERRHGRAHVHGQLVDEASIRQHAAAQTTSCCCRCRCHLFLIRRRHRLFIYYLLLLAFSRSL